MLEISRGTLRKGLKVIFEGCVPREVKRKRQENAQLAYLDEGGLELGLLILLFQDIAAVNTQSVPEQIPATKCLQKINLANQYLQQRHFTKKVKCKADPEAAKRYFWETRQMLLAGSMGLQEILKGRIAMLEPEQQLQIFENLRKQLGSRLPEEIKDAEIIPLILLQLGQKLPH